MSRQSTLTTILLVVAICVASGCRPAQPVFLRGKRDDFTYYVDKATDVEYPDVHSNRLSEVAQAKPPRTISNAEFHEFWDLSLEEVASIALQNSKVIRNLGTTQLVGVPNTSLARPESTTTVYDPAVLESDPQAGVEAALSAFDTQFSTSVFWDKTDRPQNFGFFQPVLQRNAADFVYQLNKKTATGTEVFFRNRVNYEWSNNPFQSNPSVYTAAYEAEVRQPLLRGAGTRINRIPIVLARINTDVSLADFEANVRNLVLDVENAYWDLHCAYRTVEAAKLGRDSARTTWDLIYKKWKGGVLPHQQEAQAREQYFFFRVALETALRDLQNAENSLRYLMGLTSTDGRMIRPKDEPSMARVKFDWHEVQAESLVRTAELRRQNWVIKQRELELLASRNQLLPQLNAVALYRWLGVGDELIAAKKNDIRFPNAGSRAYEELLNGDFQELRFGVEFAMPVGYRKELSGVRNAELKLAREHARLEDMELAVIHLLGNNLRDLDANYQFARSHFNRIVAASDELRNIRSLYENGKVTLNVVLDAQRRRAESQNAYYRALCDYNKSIAAVHFRKGSLLDYNSIRLAEGPWPEKAYVDARGRARRRAAGFVLNYGRTRPADVSRGPLATNDSLPVGQNPQPEPVPAPQPWPADIEQPRGNDEIRRLPPPPDATN